MLPKLCRQHEAVALECLALLEEGSFLCSSLWIHWLCCSVADICVLWFMGAFLCYHQALYRYLCARVSERPSWSSRGMLQGAVSVALAVSQYWCITYQSIAAMQPQIAAYGRGGMTGLRSSP